MTNPKLDDRTIEDIISLIKQKSEFYTPEWRFDPSEPDAGGAIARIFAEMFYETVDRYNRFPDKCYLEFLNMQGVCAKPVSPAVGMAAATLVDGAAQSVFIKKGTQLFTDLSDPDSGEKRVVFETTSGYFATPAELTAIYMTNPVKDVTTRTETACEDSFPLQLFNPDSAKNIEKHGFSLAQSAVLNLTNAAEIRVKIANSAMAVQNEHSLNELCRSDFAKWGCYERGAFTELSAERDGDCVVLTKTDNTPFDFTDEYGAASEEGSPRLFCNMTAFGGAEDIIADKIELNCRSAKGENGGIAPEYIFSDDTEIVGNGTGYCFGKEPQVYGSFLFSSGEAFSKRGAQIVVEITLSTIVVGGNEPNDDGDDIKFNNKLLVDKEASRVADYDNVFISEVVWEYWNGFGWAGLEVKGSVNPFSCEKEGKNTIIFTCPDDFAPSVQNAHEGLWVRARVRSIENRYSTRAKWLLPMLKNLRIHFDYMDKFLPAEEISAWDDCKLLSYVPNDARLEMKLFGLMKEKRHAVYFRFDRMPDGYPINLYFDFVGSTDEERIIAFEYLSGGIGGRAVWSELKTVDGTQGFENSGIISLYNPKDFCEAELFGEKGFWIRAVNRSMQYNPDVSVFPRLKSIVKNTVEIVQKQSVGSEIHEVFAGKLNQSIRLKNIPIIDCGLWINELPETPVSQLREIAEKDGANVRTVVNANGELAEFWVKWEQKITLAESGSNDRHYTLDASTGEIRFGNGINGKVPSYNAALQVDAEYSFGGGTYGNLPTGALDGLIVSIPFVENMTNIVSCCGGSDGQDIETIRDIGTKHLKNYGRAVTAEDFECLVREEFTEAAEVRCFPNRDRNAKSADGFVTVVVKPHDYSNVSYTISLCRRIEDFLKRRAGCELVKGKRLAVIPAVPMKISTEITVQLDNYDFAAETERNIIAVVSEMLDSERSGGKIGFMPTVSDFMTALKRIEHISYISRILLAGEYYRDSELVTVALDGSVDYRYFVAANGRHIVKF